jgi:hypothetical protein
MEGIRTHYLLFWGAHDDHFVTPVTIDGPEKLGHHPFFSLIKVNNELSMTKSKNYNM